ncbi:MAG: LysR family transcriptional regulator [Methanothermobacter sp.]|nr:LysR family transcriptional regulator [Methanothermobacter sp.]
MDMKPLPGMEINGHRFDHRFFETLRVIGETFSQRRAARILGVSPQVLNRRVLRAESLLGVKLVRSSGAGSELTPEAMEILGAYMRQIRILEGSGPPMIAAGYISSNLVEAAIEFLGLSASLFSCCDEDSFHLAERSMLDAVFLDDPLQAYRRDLDFVPIAYDHLVLVGRSVNDIRELDGSSFVGVSGSAQRLAWEVLSEAGVEFEVVREVRSPYHAYRIVMNDQGLSTFLNASQFQGSDILRAETRHVISAVKCRDGEGVHELLEFLTSEGQALVAEAGFEPLH